MDHNTFRLVRFSTVRDVLGFFRDKTVRDVLDPDSYCQEALAVIQYCGCYPEII
jgi:hypothetical protein